MRRILCIGEQSELLGTRADLLRKTGAEVTCMCADSASEVVGKSRFDLVVICHTVESKLAKAIARVARLGPGTPAVILLTPYIGAGPESDDPAFDMIAQAFPGPLLHMASEMMGMKRHAPVASH